MKNDVLNYYNESRRFWGVYHNHKETCAWAGLVLHAIFCNAILKLDIKSLPNSYPNQAFAGIVVIESIIICLYMNSQFGMKDKGGAFAGAATELQVELIKDQNPDAWKDHVELKPSSDPKFQSSHFLPARLLKREKVMNSRGRGEQNKTRMLALGLVALWTLVTIAARWS